MRIGDHEYQIARLSTFVQFELARTLSELLSNLALISKAAGEQVTTEQFAKTMCVFAGTLTKAQSEAVTVTCLDAVTRQSAQNWARINVPGTTSLMFPDIDLSVMLQLMFLVIKEHRLIDFFGAPPSNSVGAKDPA